MFLSNLLVSENPTVFELSMSANLSQGLKPAFEYLLQTLSETTTNTVVFNATVWKDEVFLTALLLLERYYLSTYGGTFADNFYGFKRERFVNGQKLPLRSRDKVSTLALVAVFPYLKAKFLKLYTQIYTQNQGLLQQFDESRSVNSSNTPASTPLRLEFKTFLKIILIKAFPYTRALANLYVLAFQLLYVFNRTKHFTPALWFQGITISRLTSEDYRDFSMAEEIAKKQSSYISQAGSKALGFMRTLLIASAVGFKLLEWYFSPENINRQESQNIADLRSVPPPIPPALSPNGVSLPSNRSLCPLCHESRKNPAISVSGYAFCFLCLQHYVSEHKQCPVTCLPCDETQIRRIYEA